MPRSTVAREWESKGLRCAVLLTDMGHYCGYVAVPEGHPWHGIGYTEAVPTAPLDNSEYKIDEDIGVIAAFCYAAGDDDSRDRYAQTPEYQVAVHGGVTYSGNSLPGVEPGWWFGFDCAHAGDENAGWTEDRVAAEVERMAAQLAAVAREPVHAEK